MAQIESLEKEWEKEDWDGMTMTMLWEWMMRDYQRKCIWDGNSR